LNLQEHLQEQLQGYMQQCLQDSDTEGLAGVVAEILAASALVLQPCCF
jgi:hypothetical protein